MVRVLKKYEADGRLEGAQELFFQPGGPGKPSLRRGCSCRGWNEGREGATWVFGKDHARQRDRQVPSPWGGLFLARLEKRWGPVWLEGHK